MPEENNDIPPLVPAPPDPNQQVAPNPGWAIADPEIYWAPARAIPVDAVLIPERPRFRFAQEIYRPVEFHRAEEAAWDYPYPRDDVAIALEAIKKGPKMVEILDSMKAKAKTKTKPKKMKFTEEELKEARERISVFGLTVKDSTPASWNEYPPNLWVHSTEQDRFFDCYGECSLSKTWITKNKLTRMLNGYMASIEIAKSKGMEMCAHSGYLVEKENLVEAYKNGKKVKIAKNFIETGDYFMCDLTKKFHDRGSRIRISMSADYRFISKYGMDCNPRMFSLCEGCGNMYPAELVQQRPIAEAGRNRPTCRTCWSREAAKGVIRPHNYDKYPNPIHRKVEFWRMADHGDSRRRKKIEDVGIRLFGVEVETELNKKGLKSDGVDRLQVAVDVRDTLGEDFVIIKEDGSLSMNGHYASGDGMFYAGFEIVSAPADIEVHRKKWEKLHAMKNFKHLRAWETATCGFHVHVSKDALTTLQIGRILMFMTHKDNKKFVARVAGRGENKYCKVFHKDKLSEGIQYGKAEVRNGVEYIQADFHLARSDDARRQAVNITNPKTIEFRIFRGTVHPRHIIRNIEFCDAVCTFCHPGARSLKELYDWNNFIHFCAENRKDYPMLVEWMESPDIQLLPTPKNAYGPKDTRGTKRPDVAESRGPEIKLEDRDVLVVNRLPEDEPEDAEPELDIDEDGDEGN